LCHSDGSRTNGIWKSIDVFVPQETGFLRYLQAAAKVTLTEYKFPNSKIANVQSQLESLIEKNYYLNKVAREAYRSYLLAYASHSHREIYNVHALG
jgi:ATP-dependent RNA helicase DDX18/HAS1